MQNPKAVNLIASPEVRRAGWAAEARDRDGHLMTTHFDFAGRNSLWDYYRECMSEGWTITIWPTTGAPDAECRYAPPDARLIAAAPDPLEALRRLMQEAVLDGMEARAGWDCWINCAREAIAKAEGVTPTGAPEDK